MSADTRGETPQEVRVLLARAALIEAACLELAERVARLERLSGVEE
ncbi:hypothetical protein [Nocardia otitidiscaviarum]|nr:hypothetical protein [Nocardia otitidiscaviarum]